MNKSINYPNDKGLSGISTYRAGVIQSQAHRKLKKEVTSFLKPHGLTMMEWFGLGLIRDCGNEGIRLTKLSSDLQTTLPYTTNLVNGLMFKGYITRDTDTTDNRAKILKLTPGTEKKCKEIESDLRKKMRILIYSNIKPDELTTYVKVLYQIANSDSKEE